jgi:hypothetical protein
MERGGGMKKLYHYPSMFILSVVSALVLILFEATLFVSQVLFKENIYSEALGKFDIAGTIYDELDTYFEQLYAPTGIPKEVYMDSIEKSALSQASYTLLTDSLEYLTNPKADKPEIQYDFTQLESDITEYIENYADENGDEKDDDYYSLIDNTISVAESQIQSRLDVMMLYTVSQTGFAEKIHNASGYVNYAMVGVGAVLLILLAVMFAINRHHLRDMTYWIGGIMLSASAVIIAPALYLEKTGYFNKFFMRSNHIYQTVTGFFSVALDKIITAQVALLIIAVVLIVATLGIHSLYVFYLKKKDERHRD